MSILKIHKDDSPYLHTMCKDVQFPLSNEVRELIFNMKETLLSTRMATGLAAPQVGASLRIFVYRTDAHPQPMTIINPTIIKSGDFNHGLDEMCLSYPNQIYEVVRAKRITMRFFDEEGKHYILKYRGFEATILQHETDHLLGLTIKDRGVKLDAELTKKILDLHFGGEYAQNDDDEDTEEA